MSFGDRRDKRDIHLQLFSQQPRKVALLIPLAAAVAAVVTLDVAATAVAVQGWGLGLAMWGWWTEPLAEGLG